MSFPAEGAAIGLIAVGQIYSIVRNGASARNAVRKEMAEMKEICAGTRGTVMARLDNHDREIKEVKKK